MADNYLEKRYEETLGSGKIRVKKIGHTIDELLLKAVEMGLNGLIIAAFNRTKLQEVLALPYPPLLVLAIGKGDERIELTPIGEGESHAYYRKEGIHYVPKVRAGELII